MIDLNIQSAVITALGAVISAWLIRGQHTSKVRQDNLKIQQDEIHVMVNSKYTQLVNEISKLRLLVIALGGIEQLPETQVPEDQSKIDGF